MDVPANNIRDANVRVAVRCRPFSLAEKANGEGCCVSIFEDRIVLVNPGNQSDEQSFAFDLVFDQNSHQSTVWNAIGAPILSKAFDGYNGTIFAYGQTGSGKTWSMQGALDDSDLQGIIPRLNIALFHRINVEKLSRPSVQFLVTVSYFEIYNEFIFDLLDAADRRKKSATSKAGLEIKEHPVLGVYVKGLQEHVVDSAEKLQLIVDQGIRSRTVASTQMNADSSRSHSVFVITVRQKDVEDETKNIFAKVNLVDLAGSERVKSTGNSGATLKEGANINKSLSELGNVMNALVALAKGKKGVFVPYRNSKLTRVLQESLGGNSITAMLAALSPASSYYEETMSTLKYANRAKAIKVNAIKNEEASQVSKLNDEIKQLKEKLQGQNLYADTSLLEERHRQQLRDLEEAMKSTWEAKSKVSDEHEKERKRLEIEQRAAAALFVANRDRNWRLLEEKGDLDLSLSHIKEISSYDDRIARHLIVWSDSLRNIALQEQSLCEHYTVVQVYRSALEKDNRELFRVQESPRNGNGSGSGPGSADDIVRVTAQGPFTLPSFSFDTPTLSLWSQFNDKIQATKEEVVVWMALQDQFLASVTELSTSVQRVTSDAISQYKNKNKNRNRNEISSSVGIIHKNAGDEILQGLQMFSRQSKEKLIKSKQGLYESRKNVANFAVLGNDIQVTIEEYEKVLSCYMQEEGSAEWKLCGEESSGGEKGSEDRIFEMGSLLDKLKRTSQILHDTSTRDTHTHDDMGCRSRSPLLMKAQSPMQSPLQTPRSSRDVITTEILFDYDVQCTHGRLMVQNKNSDSYHQLLTKRDDNNNYNNNNNNHNNNNDHKSKCRSDIMVDGNSFWTLNKTDLTNTTEIQPSPYVQINLKECVILTSVILQGGLIIKPQHSNQNQNTPSNITLQCGINLSNCDGDVALTSLALGEVINWTALLRKTGPEKFLQRPPIRFLFDLFVHCGWEFPNLFPCEVRDADWDRVGESKQAKLEYMDVMILFLSEYLNVSSPTCAASIVSGSNSDLTNILLQHLAIAIYWYKGTTSFPTSTSSSPRHIKDDYKLESSGTTAAFHNSGRNAEAMIDCWPTEIGISTSFDGTTWRHNNPANHYKAHITSLTNSDNKVEILLEESEIAVQHIRIFPFKWSSSLGESNILFKDDIKSALAVRASVRAQCLRTTKNLIMSVDDAAHSPSNQSCGADGVKVGGAYWSGDSVPSPRGTLSVLEALHEVTVVVIAALTYLNGAEQLRKLRKQEEIRKKMENLASEKMILELTLANEKRDAVCEKENLGDQLRNALEGLYKAQSAQEQERALKTQYQLEKNLIEDEKQSLQIGLRDQLQQTSILKSELLKFQATHEKNRMLIDSLKSQLAEDGRVIVEMSLQRNEAKVLEELWDVDKDDLLCQISILTDERDAAQRSEEELYESLGDKAQDLEILQESYVVMTDRCNDANDEISDLREQLQVLREALAERNAAIPIKNNSLDSIEESNSAGDTTGFKGIGLGIGILERAESEKKLQQLKDASKDRDRDRDKQLIKKEREKEKENLKEKEKNKNRDKDKVLRSSTDEFAETQPRNVLCTQAIVWSSSSSARQASHDSDSVCQTDSAFDSVNKWIEVDTEAETEAEVTPPRKSRGLARTFSVEKTTSIVAE